MQDFNCAICDDPSRCLLLKQAQDALNDLYDQHKSDVKNKRERLTLQEEAIRQLRDLVSSLDNENERLRALLRVSRAVKGYIEGVEDEPEAPEETISQIDQEGEESC